MGLASRIRLRFRGPVHVVVWCDAAATSTARRSRVVVVVSLAQASPFGRCTKLRARARYAMAGSWSMQATRCGRAWWCCAPE